MTSKTVLVFYDDYNNPRGRRHTDTSVYWSKIKYSIFKCKLGLTRTCRPPIYVISGNIYTHFH